MLSITGKILVLVLRVMQKFGKVGREGETCCSNYEEMHASGLVSEVEKRENALNHRKNFSACVESDAEVWQGGQRRRDVGRSSWNGWVHGYND